jgi:hypothetical protein
MAGESWAEERVARRAFFRSSPTDPFAWDITCLRGSVTDRCDFRCVYCMAEDMTFLPKRDVFSLEELDRLCSAFAARGVRKLRLTGGEPLVRRGFMTLVRGEPSFSYTREKRAIRVGRPLRLSLTGAPVPGAPKSADAPEPLGCWTAKAASPA